VLGGCWEEVDGEGEGEEEGVAEGPERVVPLCARWCVSDYVGFFCEFGGVEGERLGLLYHDDIVQRITPITWSRGNADGDGVGPVGFHERRDDEEHESNTASRLARCPA